jgi:dihydrofolate reductase
MRKVVAGLFISADGITEAPDQWQEQFDEEMGAEMVRQMAEIDTIMLGRVTYSEWVNYWPNATTDLDFANFINNAPKYVVSDTLSEVNWGKFDKPTLVRGKDLASTIAKLKQQPGKNIAINGSPTLVRNLIEADLLDELSLLIHPVIAAKGKPLFAGLRNLKRLGLVLSKPTSSGTVIANYALRKPE